MKSSPHSPQLEKGRAQQQRRNAAKHKLGEKKNLCAIISNAHIILWLKKTYTAQSIYVVSIILG